MLIVSVCSLDDSVAHSKPLSNVEKELRVFFFKVISQEFDHFKIELQLSSQECESHHGFDTLYSAFFVILISLVFVLDICSDLLAQFHYGLELVVEFCMHV